MSTVQRQRRSGLPAALGVLTLVGVGVLLVCDVSPRVVPAQAHDFLAALPLLLIALACVVYQAARRAPRVEWANTGIVTLAFLFWAANHSESEFRVWAEPLALLVDALPRPRGFNILEEFLRQRRRGAWFEPGAHIKSIYHTL
ncbi:MAG TPA: hypothetical protein VNZ26_05030 [Vicinamibacterales bacterium]|jgi:hypothetical protein|nr:hypothetical protein [Vicinamibacterales bacterium]